jgi:hypothetical protein
MSEALQKIINELEAKRHELMSRANTLNERREDLAIQILADNYRLAEMELREIDEEVDYIGRKVCLHDLAIAGLRRRALTQGRDADEVMREITEGKIRYE